jgi:hypothetical protein
MPNPPSSMDFDNLDGFLVHVHSRPPARPRLTQAGRERRIRAAPWLQLRVPGEGLEHDTL